jgi:hypothetical protein
MAEVRRGLTAEERMRELQRDKAMLRRERMLREVAGPRWRRMVRIVPVLFRREGEMVAKVLQADIETVLESLRPDAVFALDTAMRLAHGFGFLAVREVQAYVTSLEPLDRLAEEGLIAAQSFADTTLVRPWPGPPRLLACLVEGLPSWRELPGGYRVVTRERLGRELVGAVGPRADLYALYEKAEGRDA